MINSNELKLNNWVLIYDEPQQIFMISGIGVNDEVINFTEVATDFKDIFPIPLSEEWLLKFGFNNGTGWFTLTKYPTCINVFKKTYAVTIGCNEEYEIECKYVHQLQNLYFALTGKELEIINQ